MKATLVGARATWGVGALGPAESPGRRAPWRTSQRGTSWHRPVAEQDVVCRVQLNALRVQPDRRGVVLCCICSVALVLERHRRCRRGSVRWCGGHLWKTKIAALPCLALREKRSSMRPALIVVALAAVGLARASTGGISGTLSANGVNYIVGQVVPVVEQADYP